MAIIRNEAMEADYKHYKFIEMSIHQDLYDEKRRTHELIEIKKLRNETLAILEAIEDKPIYRISIHDRTGKVTTNCYDLIENFAPELQREYNDVNEMPTWAKERIAVLMLLDPTRINDDIENVGRRISRNVYWLYKENENGDDPRREGQEGST